MSNDILDKGSSGRRILLLLTLLLLLMSALIFLFNRKSFMGNNKQSTEPVVISPNGAVKTFPDDSKKQGEMPAAKVYDMLQQKPPAASNKKPNSVKDIVNNSAPPASGQPNGQATGQASKQPSNNTAAKPVDGKADKTSESKSNNRTAKKAPVPSPWVANPSPDSGAASTTATSPSAPTVPGATKPANPPAASVADLVSNSVNKSEMKDNNKDNKAAKPATKTVDKNAAGTTKSATPVNVATGAPAGAYGLQLASFTDEATAQKFLTAIKPQIQKIITGQTLDFKVSSGVLSNGQRVYRMQVGGFATKEMAEQSCQKIKSQVTKPSKPDCLVLKSL